MSDPQVLNTLRRKRDAINEAIKLYEDKLAQARRDLANVSATIRLFEVGDEPLQFPVYMDIGRLFRPREIGKLCHTALALESPLDTRELALRVMRAKGMDESDKVLRSSVAHRVVQALSMQLKRGQIASPCKRDGVRLWGNLNDHQKC
ncbi:hypothetical protein [Bosea sp. CS1GBMeth4]|uniref:hypothetical protein n=1 Tax=Bosea sp. CS1GBMeth4 TaxID=1892849 RepID=UPI001648B28A|nr:hypothetical protein [Bosea sp. CS1GBMeth4]